MARVKKSRWRQAQTYERRYWEGRSREIEAGGSQLGWYSWRADRLAECLESLDLRERVDGKASVLEIGSGPVGIVSFLAADTLVAVDPLAAFYARDGALSEQRLGHVQFLASTGERLPFSDDCFDLLLIDNCIDHVEDVDAVMGEISRVLRPDGVLYLTVNVRTRTGTGLHRVLSRLRIDLGHPHSFSVSDAHRLIQRYPFELLSFESGDYTAARKADLAADSWKTRLKSVLGVSEFLVTCVARRADDTE